MTAALKRRPDVPFLAPAVGVTQTRGAITTKTVRTPFTDAPWLTEYAPYIGRDDREIPCYRIIDDEGNTLGQTNEDLPDEVQEQVSCLMAAAPDLFDALEHFFNIMHDYDSSECKGYFR